MEKSKHLKNLNKNIQRTKHTIKNIKNRWPFYMKSCSSNFHIRGYFCIWIKCSEMHYLKNLSWHRQKPIPHLNSGQQIHSKLAQNTPAPKWLFASFIYKKKMCFGFVYMLQYYRVATEIEKKISPSKIPLTSFMIPNYISFLP